MRRNLVKALIAVGDYVLMVVSLLVMVSIRYADKDVASAFSQHYESFWYVFVVWIAVFYVSDLYNFNAPFNHRYFLLSMGVNLFLTVTFYYVFPGLEISPKRNLLIVAGAYVLLFYGWRFLFNRIIDRKGSSRAVAIIGSDEHSIALAESIQTNSREGFHVGIILCEHDSCPDRIGNSAIAIATSVQELKAVIREQRIGTVIISRDWYGRVYRELYDLVSLRIRFYQLSTFWEQFNETIPIYATDEGWFLENLNQSAIRSYSMLKRVLDFVFSVVLTVLFSPFMVLTAIAVLFSGPGPILFRQTRVGRNGRHFTILKFRSMRKDAEKNGAQWATENDPRITPVGRFIRAVRLDELPQLYNVFRGDMSFIGPRPERPEFVDELAQRIPHYDLRLMAKPGLTGWAQVKLGYTSTEEESANKLTYDLYYVKNLSFVLDFKIMLKTVLTVLSRAGR